MITVGICRWLDCFTLHPILIFKRLEIRWYKTDPGLFVFYMRTRHWDEVSDKCYGTRAIHLGMYKRALLIRTRLE